MDKLFSFLVMGVVSFWPVACAQPQETVMDNSSNIHVLQDKVLNLAEGDQDELAGGSCSNAIMEELYKPINEFYVTDCPRQAWGGKEGTEQCLRRNISILASSEANACVGCFGQVAECAASNCKWSCMISSCSEGCVRCVENNCGTAHRQCIGHRRLPRCRANRP